MVTWLSLCNRTMSFSSIFQIPGNMRGYNSRNESIDLPPSDIMPPILKGLRDKKGILYYTVTGKFLFTLKAPITTVADDKFV